MSFTMSEESQNKELDGGARFTIFGVGGAGGNAVEHMIRSGVSGLNFVGANTDHQALAGLSAPNLVYLESGKKRGLGAGADPEVGRAATEAAGDDIAKALTNTDMVFIAAGMGGGTGTGGAPVVAKIAKDMGILTVAVVTTPLKFEQKRRMDSAKDGIDELMKHVDSIIVIPNEKVMKVYGGLSIKDAFAKADDVLLCAVTGITDTVMGEGMVNVDFEDVRTAMKNRGYAMMGLGRATGEDRHLMAAEAAINSPLLDDIILKDAKGLVINIIAAEDQVTLVQINEAVERIAQIADCEQADLIFGVTNDPTAGDEMRVMVIATGLTREETIGAGIAAKQTTAFDRQQVGSLPRSAPQAETVSAREEPSAKLGVMDYLKRQQKK